MPSFASATKVVPISSHTYSATLEDAWCLGKVPHGGYTTSLFQCVASTHFQTVLAHLNQPHTLAVHLQFLHRTSCGPGTFMVKDVNLGSRTSTVHISLTQAGAGCGGKTLEKVVGYVIHTDRERDGGEVTAVTEFSLHPPPYAVDLPRLGREGKYGVWEPLEMSQTARELLKVTSHIEIYVPKAKHFSMVRDQWMRLTPYGCLGKFTNAALGFVVDMFPFVAEEFLLSSSALPPGSENSGTRNQNQLQWRFWSPTLLLNLEVKKLLPSDGVTWLFLRVECTQIRNGRLDLQITVLDEGGEVVALSNHVSLVVSREQNIRENSEHVRAGQLAREQSKI